MKRARLLLCIVASATIGALAITFAPDPAPPSSRDETSSMPTQISLAYVSRTNTTTDILRAQLESSIAHATGRVLIEDPAETPAKTLRVVNLTTETSRDIPLRSLPPLVRVRGVIDLPGTPVLTKWVWQGRAHVVIADTPAGLAQALSGGDTQ